MKGSGREGWEVFLDWLMITPSIRTGRVESSEGDVGGSSCSQRGCRLNFQNNNKYNDDF